LKKLNVNLTLTKGKINVNYIFLSYQTKTDYSL